MTALEFTGAEIRALREKLRLPQHTFGALFGLGTMQVSRLEHDTARITPFQRALLAAATLRVNNLHGAAAAELGGELAKRLAGEGVPKALVLLLEAGKD